MKYPSLLTLLLVHLCSPLLADEAERVLFDFADAESAAQWQTVNDGVMGGRSEGQFRITKDRKMEFSGVLSLENNGGFASVRSQESRLDLKQGDSIVARVRGDGREYNFNLYVPRDLGRNSFRQSFKTKKGEWIDVTLPVEDCLATFRGRVIPNAKLDPSKATALGIHLGDSIAGRFKLEVDWIKVATHRDSTNLFKLGCEGTYKHHLQGICAADDALYWSFTTTLVKTDLDGKLMKKVPVANHHGDLCFSEGKLYVAVNLGEFNHPKGNADSWVYVYDAVTLDELSRHETQEVFHGAGGIGIRNDHFFVVGGLPDGVMENYVYEYDDQFKFLKRHVVNSGHTHLGIQTATFAHDRWWFGCYGTPKILLVTNSDFQMKGRYEQDCSLGIEGLPGGRLLIGSGRCETNVGCIGTAQSAIPDPNFGIKFRESDRGNSR